MKSENAALRMVDIGVISRTASLALSLRVAAGEKQQRSVLPVYSEKQTVSGDFLIFSWKRSFLLRKSMIDVSVNHLLLQMESKRVMLSIIRFCAIPSSYKISCFNDSLLLLLQYCSCMGARKSRWERGTSFQNLEFLTSVQYTAQFRRRFVDSFAEVINSAM